MRDALIKATKQHALGHVEKHRVNVEILMNNPVGIGEHGDVMEEIEKEILEMAKYQDVLDILEKYFS